MSSCESSWLHVEPGLSCDHKDCYRHRSMCEGDSTPCAICWRSFKNNVEHWGVDAPAAMGNIEKHYYKDYRLPVLIPK